MKKKLKLTLVILFILIFAFIIWFIWQIANKPAPRFFPLANPNARYTVVKSSKMAQGNNETITTDSADLPNDRYYIEYRGKNVFADDNNKNFFRITVGKSKKDLEPFINKDVRIIKGEFVSSSRQCIVDRCIDIFGNYIVLNIDQLKSAD